MFLQTIADTCNVSAAARAIGMTPPCFVPGDAPVVDIASAIHLWSEHKKQQAGTKRRGWAPRPLPSIEEVQGEIARKVAAVRKHGVGNAGTRDAPIPRFPPGPVLCHDGGNDSGMMA